MDDATKADVAAWTGCVAGALTDTEFRAILHHAGFEGIEIRQTHSVHAHASAAIIRARKPTAETCCSPATMSSCCEPKSKADCCGTTDGPAPPSCGCGT